MSEINKEWKMKEKKKDKRTLKENWDDIYLTRMQYEVWIRYSQQGMTQKQIAEELKISQPEVCYILKFVAKKIGRDAIMRHRKDCEFVKITKEDLV